MNFSRKLAAGISLIFFFIGATAQAHETQKYGGLKMPESVLVDKHGHVFVSEIGEFGKDGDGQVSVLGKDGKFLVFAKGLDDPKGLAMIEQVLYVADKQRIFKIDMHGKVEVFVDAQAFPTAPQFLNDLEADSDGNLYVSDSGDLKGGGGVVYKIDAAGKVTTLIDAKQDPRIAAPNGLLMGKTPNCIMIVDFASGVLYRYDSKKAELSEEAKGFGGGDGIVQTANGDYLISDWKGGQVFRLKLDKPSAAQVDVFQDGYVAAADIALSTDKKTLYVPDMKAGALFAIRLHD
jgi:gluconolactonase